MFDKPFPPLIGTRVIVKIPDGLPELMMKVTREMLRSQPKNEQSAYSIAANYLERLLEERRENEKRKDLEDVVMNSDKTDEPRIIDMLLESGHTEEQLNKKAIIIQQKWKHYKSNITLRSKPDSDIHGANENLTKTISNQSRKFNVENNSETKLQLQMKNLDECEFENSLHDLDTENDSDDSAESFNVVKKCHEDYEPLTSDITYNDFDSYKDEDDISFDL